MRALVAGIGFALGASAAPAFEVDQSESAITVRRGGKTVLVYHKAEVAPPEGADPRFRRSGFIHPLCSPAGEPVTGIHPDDHIHHVGLWGAWVNTRHDGRQPDFWNLKKGTGRVRFAAVKAVEAGADTATVSVLQDYVSYGEDGDGLVVLKEELTLRVGIERGAYRIGYTSKQSNVTGAPLVLPAYRYGGPVAYRGPAAWDKDNSTVLTSEGKTRADGHASRARWAAFAGPVSDGRRAGLAILCHPGNRDAPQRVRIWPASSHDGAVFFNYVPIQEHRWQIDPGQTVSFRYALLVHDGATDAARIEDAWRRWSAE